ncbi:MAG: hypothetical protein ACE5IH_05260 [Thermodesulfobacteriota bacterium]
MSKVLEMPQETHLVNIERLAHIIQGLTTGELETLELLIDKDALSTISKSLKELKQGKGIPIDEW